MDSKWRRRERRLLEQQRSAIPQKLPNILRQPGIIQQQIEAQFFSGPLPAPDSLEHYERVQPGLAQQIVAMAQRQYAMAEAQTTHRIDIEKRVVKHNIYLSYLGWASGFILGGGGLASAVWLIYVGRQLGGAAAFVTSLATLAGIFFFGRKRQTEELANKRDK
jgi:uncharacterized membrane protein